MTGATIVDRRAACNRTSRRGSGVIEGNTVNLRDRSSRLRPATFAVVVATAAGAFACARTPAEPASSDPDAATDSAAPGSSEGVLIIPSVRAEDEYSPARLYELSEALRPPAARCFLERAIETMAVQPGDPRGYTGIPDGQLKLRIRVADKGVVQQLDVVESGFTDPVVPECFAEVVRTRTWPETRTAYPPPLEIVYWVKVGPPPASPEFAEILRRQTAEVGVRGKNCLQGRVEPGAYTFHGLNLVGARGDSLATRVEPSPETSVPEPVRDCLAVAFRELQLAPEDETFVRPVDLRVNYVVDADGRVAVEDEAWLRLVHLEELARRAELARRSGAAHRPGGASASRDRVPADDAPEASSTDAEPPEDAAGPESEPAAPALDPGQAGLKLDLSGRGAPPP